MAAETTPNADIEALSYEDAREQLVGVVGKLEAGGASLEESLALWERGEALARRCEEWLEGARKRLAAARDQAGRGPADPPDRSGALHQVPLQVDVEFRHRPLQLQAAKRLKQQLLDRDPGIPFLVAGTTCHGAWVGGGLIEGVLVGVHVVVPEGAFLQVRRRCTSSAWSGRPAAPAGVPSVRRG